MRKIRNGLYGNFIPLRHAVDAIATRVVVRDDEVEMHRGFNSPKGRDDFEASIDRAIISNILRAARAAGILLRLLNQPPGSRPTWLDAPMGFPILDDNVHRQGLDALVRWKRDETAIVITGGPRSWGALTPPSPELTGEPSRSLQIGFDIDEFIRFLNAKGVPHNLGEALDSSNEGDDEASAVSTLQDGPVAGLPATTVMTPAGTGGGVNPRQPIEALAEFDAVASLASLPAKSNLEHFNDFGRPGKQCPIEPEIREAQRRCTNRHRPQEVMARLLDMANAGHPVLIVKDECLNYLANGGKPKIYTMNALRQFISVANEMKREEARQRRRESNEVE